MNGNRQPAGTRRDILCLAGGASFLLVGLATRVKADEPAAGPSVTIDNFSFKPALLTVPVGTTVTWTNHDDIPHSFVCPGLKARSHVLDTGQSYSLNFEKAGGYDYFCGLHPHMKGRVNIS